MKEKRCFEIINPNRNYINLTPTNDNVRFTKIGKNLYFFSEIIPCGDLSIEINFMVNNNGRIGPFVTNNYFESKDCLNHISEYKNYKKDLLRRIKLDIEARKEVKTR
jgi:hypothetical protein